MAFKLSTLAIVHLTLRILEFDLSRVFCGYSGAGMIPKFCQAMYAKIEQGSQQTEYQVTVSMLEIYNEVIRDLLDPAKDRKGLKLRERQKSGFYGQK